MTRLKKNIAATIGDAICDLIEQDVGEKVEIVCLVFPSTLDNPQPQILTSYPPEIAESILEQIGSQLPTVRSSRRVI